MHQAAEMPTRYTWVPRLRDALALQDRSGGRPHGFPGLHPWIRGLGGGELLHGGLRSLPHSRCQDRRRQLAAQSRQPPRSDPRGIPTDPSGSAFDSQRRIPAIPPGSLAPVSKAHAKLIRSPSMLETRQRKRRMKMKKTLGTLALAFLIAASALASMGSAACGPG